MKSCPIDSCDVCMGQPVTGYVLDVGSFVCSRCELPLSHLSTVGIQDVSVDDNCRCKSCLEDEPRPNQVSITFNGEPMQMPNAGLLSHDDCMELYRKQSPLVPEARSLIFEARHSLTQFSKSIWPDDSGVPPRDGLVVYVRGGHIA